VFYIAASTDFFSEVTAVKPGHQGLQVNSYMSFLMPSNIFKVKVRKLNKSTYFSQ